MPARGRRGRNSGAPRALPMQQRRQPAPAAAPFSAPGLPATDYTAAPPERQTEPSVHCYPY